MACQRGHQAGGRLGKIARPRTLPTCEGGYKPFKIGDLFTAANGNTDIQKNDIDGIGEYVISSGTMNNGIIGRSSIKAKIFQANTITIDMFGNVYFHPYRYKMVTHARVFSMEAKSFKISETIGLYFVSTLSYLKYLFSYNNMCSWEKTKDLSIYLPTTAAGDIDFSFIESRVRELEEERVRELDAYLRVAGFEDCTLSDAEREALSSFTGGGIRTQQYRINDLFEKPVLGIRKKFNKKEDVSTTRTAVYNLPLVNAKHGNNGIMYYGKECDFDSVSMSIDIVGDGAISTGDVYPQPDKTGVLYNAYLICPKQGPINEPIIVYFSVAIQKAIKHKYGYDNKATWEKVQRESISLPVTAGGAIDYVFMETLIRAMEKQCIARLKAAFAREREAYLHVITANA